MTFRVLFCCSAAGFGGLNAGPAPCVERSPRHYELSGEFAACALSALSTAAPHLGTEPASGDAGLASTWCICSRNDCDVAFCSFCVCSSSDLASALWPID